VKFVFAEHVLDIDRRELRRSGKPIALEPQVFDLLVYLVQNRDRVVSKDDLPEAIWGGRIVSDSALTSWITAVRKAIGDNGAEQRLIRTVSRKGLRFVGAVREEEEPLRKLAAIFAADVEGYSRLMGQDEVGTLRRLTACRAVLDERIAAFRGRIFGSAGDSVIADFASAADAVQCALAVQEALATEEQSVSASASMSATSSCKATICLATGSTSRRVWRRSPRLAVSASPEPCAIRSAPNCLSPSPISANSGSKI